MTSTWNVDRVITEKRPRGIGALHFFCLMAGARIIRTFARGHSWFLMSRVTVVLRGIFFGPSKAVFRVFGCRSIEIALTDDYWVPSIMLGHENEREILTILPQILDEDSLFVDVGANVGWWSLYASTIIPDPARVVAIEPAASTFGDLMRNCQLNQNSFTCLRAAIWSEGGQRLSLRFSNRAREGAHVEWDGGPSNRNFDHTEQVPSVCLDDIIDDSSMPVSSLVVKLDVEGVEIQALRGAQRNLNEIDVIIYEDHGNDPEARVTSAVMELGFEIFFGDRSGQMRPINSIDEARAVKRNARIGYNFFAVRPRSRTAGEVHERLRQACRKI